MKIIPFEDFIRRFYSGEEFVVFDTETTGLNTFHDDIIEIGAFKWSKKGKGDSFQELIWTSPNKFSEEAFEIHKIPKSEIEKARKPEEVLKDFINFCEEKALVSHNIKFDYPMLNSNLIRSGLKPYQNDFVACSLIYAKEQMRPGKLNELANHYKIKITDTALHRAMYDVEVLISILEAIMKENEPEDMQYSLIL